MTLEEYERWKDFACRMALHGWPRARVPKPSAERVLGWVEQWFGWAPDAANVTDWDHSREGPCVGDEVDDWLWEMNPYAYWPDDPPSLRKKYEAWDEKWGDRVRSCLRAGLDLAASPSAGVWGFTADDLRRMYPEGVPDWVKRGWVEGPDDKPIDFDGLADDVELRTGGGYIPPGTPELVDILDDGSLVLAENCHVPAVARGGPV